MGVIPFAWKTPFELVDIGQMPASGENSGQKWESWIVFISTIDGTPFMWPRFELPGVTMQTTSL
jgi:hypothetical protein